MALPKIANKFNSAIEKTDKEQKITELQAEVEKLRASHSPELEEELKKLRENLQHQSGELEVDLGLIDPNPSQPRQTITPESIQAKARLLKKHGQITSVILVRQDNGRYMLLDGQLRWEAAKLLKWSTIRSVVVASPKDLDQSSLLTFLGFEDLNPLDKAEAVFKELNKSTGLELDLISTAMGTILKRLERDKKIKELTKLISVSAEEQQEGLELLGVMGEEQDIFLILLELGLNPNSVKSNLMPMLFLPEDLKEAIRQQGLKGAHALALSTLSAKILNTTEKKATLERTNLTQKVIQENLTVPETRQEIKKIKAKYLKSEKRESQEVSVAIDKINKLSKDSLETASSEQLAKLRTLLEEKIAQIDSALEG
ncbi:ParB/RepB/Spo0J family partition protein [Rivularia sp. UHCC 0363]|uniref:ParB/RepB/Spo0J family partition protein n=1 Tax=Rivularia sp. UHCC 0363 TaxID=3110244 RepID=UPI002B20048A|nr:ParB N-terminal domain-containing protein [Rivularia sp. UHCC 0363]MEA5595458.1 ParB N-terminal domain-containing protein [Rivularia sp. UHCC 0363]